MKDYQYDETYDDTYDYDEDSSSYDEEIPKPKVKELWRCVMCHVSFAAEHDSLST